MSHEAVSGPDSCNAENLLEYDSHSPLGFFSQRSDYGFFVMAAANPIFGDRQTIGAAKARCWRDVSGSPSKAVKTKDGEDIADPVSGGS